MTKDSELSLYNLLKPILFPLAVTAIISLPIMITGLVGKGIYHLGRTVLTPAQSVDFSSENSHASQRFTGSIASRTRSKMKAGIC